ncbi:MAG: glycosyltransferase family 4 protein [Verrucomicrobiota bacterium]|nr:glycosyltransferase family 4 protein [Verrucomicrobiota bacterium]
MRVLIATVRTPFISGGAEAHADELLQALLAEGHQAEILSVPFNPSQAECIPDQMLACRLLDLREIDGVPVDRVIALKFPAYFIRHPHKVIWLLHQYRGAYDLWEHEMGGLRAAPRGRIVRDIVRQADRGMAAGACAIYTNSGNVSQRLRHFSGIEAPPLYHPPPQAASFFCADRTEDYFFYPSRLSRTKRQELVLRALALTREPVRMKFAGRADSPAFGQQLRELAHTLGVGKRVEWLGFINDDEKRDLYASVRAVVFPPLDEDYGYITLEAMLASKPVITCDDSGGPLEFILPDETGSVAQPTAESLAAAMDTLWRDPALAARYGQAARRHYQSLNLSWSHVVKTLLA